MKVWSVVQIILIIILAVFSVNMLTQKFIPNEDKEKENFEDNKEEFSDLIKKLENSVKKLENAADKIDRFNEGNNMNSEDVDDDVDVDDEDEVDDEEEFKSNKKSKKMNKKSKKSKKPVDDEDNYMEKFTSYSGMSSKFGGDYLLL